MQSAALSATTRPALHPTLASKSKLLFSCRTVHASIQTPQFTAFSLVSTIWSMASVSLEYTTHNYLSTGTCSITNIHRLTHTKKLHPTSLRASTGKCFAWISKSRALIFWYLTWSLSIAVLTFFWITLSPRANNGSSNSISFSTQHSHRCKVLTLFSLITLTLSPMFLTTLQILVSHRILQITICARIARLRQI